MTDWGKEFPLPQPPASPAVPALKVGFWEPEKNRIEVPLAYPLDVAGEKVEALVIRRITAAQMVSIVESPDAPEDDAALIRHVVAAMAGYPVAVLDALFPDDAGRVAAAALPFMPAGLVAALERQTGPAQDGTDDAG